LVLSANVPLAKFQLNGVSVDLVFADFTTPKFEPASDYLSHTGNISPHNSKSTECMLSYLTMLELKQILQRLEPENSKRPLQVFSRVCKVVKCFAHQREMYSFKLGYLNGISIMIMVSYALAQVYHSLNKHVVAIANVS
jgi:poly(A) polymerase Pap1